jgi:hypothetical protein
MNRGLRIIAVAILGLNCAGWMNTPTAQDIIPAPGKVIAKGPTTAQWQGGALEFQVVADFWYGKDALSNVGSILDVFRADEPNKHAIETAKKASQCLTQAFNGSGYFSNKVRVKVNVDDVIGLEPSMEKGWAVWMEHAIQDSPHGRKDIPSCESPKMNVVLSHRLKRKEGCFSHARKAQLKTSHIQNGIEYRVIGDVGASDVFLCPHRDTDLEGRLLAHELLHAWGGLIDRYELSFDVATNRLSWDQDCEGVYKVNLMCKVKDCVLTKKQVEAALKHMAGGFREQKY